MITDITKEYLQGEYIDKNRTAKDIAEGLNCTKKLIEYLVMKYGMKKRVNPLCKLTKDVLLDLYVNQKMSAEDIARKLGVRSGTSVKKKLKKFNINIRHSGYMTEKKILSSSTRRKGFGDISGSYWCVIRNHAISRLLDFDITIEYAWNLFIKQSGKCSLSGVDINLVKIRQDILDGLREQTASLDRIDSSKGYTEENVQWVHKDLQKMKWDQPEDKFIDYCVKIAKYRGGLS
jgi:hypothetical protein